MRQIRPIIRAPSAGLAVYVRNYWWVGPAAEARSGTMQADGDVGLELAVHRVESVAGPPRLATGVLCWDGPCTQARSVVLEPGRGLLGVRFFPGGFYRLFGMAVRSSLSRALECTPLELADAVSQSRFAGLGEHEETARATFEALLVPRTSKVEALHESVEDALAAIEDTEGKVTLERIVLESGLSRRHFERLFRTQIGLTPGRYLRLQRLNAARSRLKAGAPSLAGVARECGFFDQSHLNREFRRSLGDSPRRYRNRDRSD